MEEISFDAVISSLPGALASVTGALERLGVPDGAVRALELSVDEAVTNIILYGYPPSNGRIWISCGVEGGMVRVQIEDEGVPFDPTEAAEPDLEGAADERPIGGLGIHLIRQMTDELRYERRDGRNILVLGKIL